MGSGICAQCVTLHRQRYLGSLLQNLVFFIGLSCKRDLGSVYSVCYTTQTEILRLGSVFSYVYYSYYSACCPSVCHTIYTETQYIEGPHSPYLSSVSVYIVTHSCPDVCHAIYTRATCQTAYPCRKYHIHYIDSDTVHR